MFKDIYLTAPRNMGNETLLMDGVAVWDGSVHVDLGKFKAKDWKEVYQAIKKNHPRRKALVELSKMIIAYIQNTKGKKAMNEKIAGMNASRWKKFIESFNNVIFQERKKGWYYFEAPTSTAKHLHKQAQEQYKGNDVEMELLKSKKVEGVAVGEYKIKVIPLGAINASIASELVKVAKDLMAIRGVIGPSGIDAPAKINLVPNRIYFMGASSSPSMIVVTKVGKDAIQYMERPFKSARREQRWIAEDLIARGSKTWLSKYAQYQPELAKSIKSTLSGGQGNAVNYKDYQPITVVAEPQGDASKAARGDQYYEAEKYGGVAVFNNGDLEIRTERGQLKEIKKNPFLKIKKIG